MKQFPVTVAAEFRGLARRAGDFVTDDGEKIEYGDSYVFEYETADGTLDTFTLSSRLIDQAAAADLDVAKMERGTVVTIQGAIGSGERGLYLRPQSIVKGVKGSQLKAA